MTTSPGLITSTKYVLKQGGLLVCCSDNSTTVHADTSTIRTLYLTFIRPHLEYANQVWDPYLVKDCKLLEDVQKFACKVCLKSWNTTYDEILDTLNIPKLEQRRKVLKLCFMHKLLGTNAPVLVPLVPWSCVYTTQYTHSKQLSSLSGHTAQYLNSVFSKYNYFME